jgi:hypothetical protein
MTCIAGVSIPGKENAFFFNKFATPLKATKTGVLLQ